MSATEQEPRKPVAGPTFRRIAAMNIAGGKRRKVVALIAAYIDGGCRPPTTGQLAHRLGLSRLTVAALLGRLERDGLVVPTRCGLGRRSPLRYRRLRTPNDERVSVSDTHDTDTGPAHNGNGEPRPATATRTRATQPQRPTRDDANGPTPRRETAP
jgi:DNA-binding transcriptional ArsR family regulator